jgi:hypothetical protein
VDVVAIAVGLDDCLLLCFRVSSASWMADSSDQQVRPFVALDSLVPSDQVRHNCSRTRLICSESSSHDIVMVAAVEQVGKRCWASLIAAHVDLPVEALLREEMVHTCGLAGLRMVHCLCGSHVGL